MTDKPNWYKDLKTTPFQEKGFEEQFRYQVLQKISRRSPVRKSRYLFYPALSLTTLILCIIAAFQLSPLDSHTPPVLIDEEFRYVAANLNEEMWHVNVIITGKVLDATNSQSLNQNKDSKKNYSVDIAPAIIQVTEVLYGDVTTPTITLLQHKSASDENVSIVATGQELILILVKTTADDYWAYDQNNGIWTINENRVEANNPTTPIDKLNGIDVNIFKKKIAKAAKNKKKPAGIQ